MVPPVGSSSRFNVRRKDDFPDPLDPTTANISPRHTDTEMLSTIGFP